jgi:hypothetical protein
MYRKSAVIAAGSYLAEDFPAEDLALWIRLVDKGKIASLPEILLNYTLHSASITQSKQGLMRAKSLDLRKEFASRPDNLATLDKTQNLLMQYKKFPGRNLRVLFFLEDLITFNQFTKGRYQKRVATIFAQQLLSRNLFLLPPLFYVDGKLTTAAEEMKLMSMAVSIVCANSTFSYWASVISDSASLVIAPNSWIKTHEQPADFFPKGWILI